MNASRFAFVAAAIFTFFCHAAPYRTRNALVGFGIAVMDDSRHVLVLTEADATSFVVTTNGNHRTVKWEGEHGFSATCDLDGDDDSMAYAFRWTPPVGQSVVEVAFPSVRIPYKDDTRVFNPYSLGEVLSRQWDRMKPGTRITRPHSASMRFGAVLNTDGDSFMFDWRDAAHRSVTFEAYKAEEGFLKIQAICPVPQTEASHKDGELPYGGVMRSFRGGWFEAAQTYRQWARRQSWSVNAANRKIGPTQDVSLWLWNRGGAEHVIAPAERVKEATGAAVAVDWYWWHSCPYDTGYPGFWPPREGVDAFKSAVARMNRAGIYSQVYVNGKAWDCDDPSFEAAGGVLDAFHFRDGSMEAIAHNPYTKHRLASMCGEAPHFQSKIRELVATLSGTGLPGVYLDQIGCSCYGACWNKSHKHPSGTSVIDGYRSHVERIRRENPALSLSTEDVNEDYLDLFDSFISMYPSVYRRGRDAGIEMVPAFMAVYHGLASFFGNYASIDGIPPWDDRWPPEDRWKSEREWDSLYPDQFAHELASGVVWGMQPTVHNLTSAQLDEQRLAVDCAFLLDTVRFHAANRDLLFFGEMMHPGRMQTAAMTVKFFARGIFTKPGKGKTIVKNGLPAVMHSIWRAPDGREAVVFVNWTRHPQKYDLDIGNGRRLVGTLPARSWKREGLETAKTVQPVMIERGADWIPFVNRKDIEPGGALDFSRMGFTDAPAGKYGWLRNVGGHFEFEGRPGKRVRLYGVNLCGTANFPTHAEAEMLVARLKRLGYNSIRLHHHDAGTVEGSNDGVTLNVANMERFDYLLATAIREGFYLTTDLFVSRTRAPIAWRHIGVDRDGDLDARLFKVLCAVFDPAFENWCAYARNFLSHTNPYTGRSYLDEPSLPLVSLVNEGLLLTNWGRETFECDIVRDAWKKWLLAKRTSTPGFCPNADPDLPPKMASAFSADGMAAILFMGDMEAKMVSRMTAFLRSIGCKALITNNNGGWNYAPMQSASSGLDFIDTHFYVDHPKFIGKNWGQPSRCDNRNPVLVRNLPLCRNGFSRMAGKPFTVTEWNFAAPGMFRGSGGMLTGAMAALQDWDGLWRFAYAASRDTIRERPGQPFSYFNLATDPLNQASDRAAICLFLRGDMESLPAGSGVSLLVTPASLTPSSGKSFPAAPSWSDVAWNMRVESCLAPQDASTSHVVLREQAERQDVKRSVQSAASNTAVAFDRERGSFIINTPRTCGGFAMEGVIAAGAIAATLGGSHATVWASSLDGKPVVSSRRILITHLTDVQGEGTTFADQERTTLLKYGKGVLVRNGTAQISLSLEDPAAYEVYELDMGGKRLGRIASEVRDGKLWFSASVDGPYGARILYECVSGKTKPL